jgi:hypothetical protein
MDITYLVIACVLSIELSLRMKFVSYANSIYRNLCNVFHVIMAPNISDHWKEKVVPTYAFIILKNSLSILGILLLIILIFFVFVVLFNTFLSLLLSITGIFISIVVSFAYLKLRLILLNA